MNDLDFDFQKRLIELMEERNITSKYQLAKICGVECSLVSKWFIEGRHLQYDSLRRICPALNISISDFFNTNKRMEDCASNSVLNTLWENLNKDSKRELIDYANYLYKKEMIEI